MFQAQGARHGAAGRTLESLATWLAVSGSEYLTGSALRATLGRGSCKPLTSDRIRLAVDVRKPDPLPDMDHFVGTTLLEPPVLERRCPAAPPPALAQRCPDEALCLARRCGEVERLVIFLAVEVDPCQ